MSDDDKHGIYRKDNLFYAQHVFSLRAKRNPNSKFNGKIIKAGSRFKENPVIDYMALRPLRRELLLRLSLFGFENPEDLEVMEEQVFNSETRLDLKALLATANSQLTEKDWANGELNENFMRSLYQYQLGLPFASILSSARALYRPLQEIHGANWHVELMRGNGREETQIIFDMTIDQLYHSFDISTYGSQLFSAIYSKISNEFKLDPGELLTLVLQTGTIENAYAYLTQLEEPQPK